MQACPSCGQETFDPANFCPACGTRLPAPGDRGQERKLVTAVFIDLVGSGPTASVDPEDLAARLVPYSEQVRRELERHGGTVEKFIGDAVVALFGAPTAHEDDPQRAVRGALAAFEAISELNARAEWLDLKIRVGINTGEALVDLAARTTTGEGMASGDVMNTAARLQEAAPVNGILVGELTYEATCDVVEYRNAGAIDAKGKSQPVPAWEVIGLRRSADDHHASGLVGRDIELRHLTALWNATLERRRPAHAVVLGSAGTGKTRLVSELAANLGGEPLVLWGRCLPYGEGITYWPMAEILESAAGIVRKDAARTAKIDALLGRVGLADKGEERVLATAASIVTGADALATSSGLSQSELHWALRRLLQLLSFERPLLIVVEDLQWAEPTMLDLLRYLTADEDGTLFVVGTSRSSATAAVRAFIEAASLSLDLEPLDDDASRELLSRLVGPEDAASDTANTILRVAGGNPLFLEEIVRILLTRGTLRELDASDPEKLPMPTSLGGLIGSRLDQLSPTEKQIAQYASVVGEVFWRGSVAHLPDEALSDEAVDRGLAELESEGFVHRHSHPTLAGDEEFAFKHILVRDVAYSQLPKARRMELHVRFAGWVQSLRDQELIEIAAWHLERACKLGLEVTRSSVVAPTSEAVAALSRAAERAKTREGWRETERFYARARELIAAGEEAALELRVRHGAALIGLGRVKAGVDLVSAAKDEALAIGRVDLAADAAIALCQVAHRQGLDREAHDRLRQLETIAECLPDMKVQLRLRFVRAAIRGEIDGAYEEALADLAEALDIAEELGETSLVIEGHLRTGFILYNMGRLLDAEAAVRHCSELAAEFGSTRDVARAQYLQALITYLRGDGDEAEQTATWVNALLERTGETFFEIQSLIALGQYALARGDASVAELHLRRALDIALDEDSFFVAEICRLLIEALVELDRVDEAAELEAFAARRVQHDHAYARAAVQMGEAALASATGDFAASVQSHQAALATLDKLGMPIDLSQARLAYGRTLRRVGDAGAAREQLELAQRACEQMGAIGLLRRVEHELALLEAAS
jgi:class 3 adenylate cyclase/tetratricopeptide (TPR) repeat protein